MPTSREAEDAVLAMGLTPAELEELALSLTRLTRKHNPGKRPEISGTMSLNGETSEWTIDLGNGGWQQWMVTQEQGFARVPYLDAMVDGLRDTNAFDEETENEEDND